MVNEQRSGARPVQRKSSSGPLGLLLVFVAVAGASALYLLTANKAVKAEVEPTAEPASPFADMPPEKPPEKRTKSE